MKYQVSFRAKNMISSHVLFLLFWFYFFFLHLALITGLFITENRKILSRRGVHLGRVTLCSLVKLHITTAKKKNRKIVTLGIIVRTAEQIYIKLSSHVKITCYLHT